MAGTEQDRTEAATPHRLEEAREKGQVAYSRDLTAALLLLFALLGLRFGGGALVATLGAMFQTAFRFEGRSDIHQNGIVSLMVRMGEHLSGMTLPFLFGVLGIVSLAGYLQVGFAIHWKRIEADFGRLNPISGFSRLISKRSLVAMFASVLKMAAVGLVAWTAVKDLMPRAADLSGSTFGAMMFLFVEVFFDLGFRVGGFILLLAAADFFWQRWVHKKDLMMSKEEVKEEQKKFDGDPAIRNRVRQVQREQARSRMLKNVKKASVVIRNPTHYAVAIRYDSKLDPAPRLLAKGKGLLALRIIELAEKAGVPVRSDPPLARQIHATVKVGRLIPEELFQAVAKVLAWVMRSRRQRSASG